MANFRNYDSLLLCNIINIVCVQMYTYMKYAFIIFEFRAAVLWKRWENGIEMKIKEGITTK